MKLIFTDIGVCTIQPNMKVYRYGEIDDIHMSMIEQKSLLKHVLFETGEFDEKSL